MWGEGLKGRFCSSIEGGVAAEAAETAARTLPVQ